RRRCSATAGCRRCDAEGGGQRTQVGRRQSRPREPQRSAATARSGEERPVVARHGRRDEGGAATRRSGKASAGNAGAQQQIQQSIADQKGAMADEVKDLKSKLDKMSLDTRRDQKEASRALAGAADTLRGRKVEEKLRYTQQVARSAPPDWMKSAEQQIGA